MTQKTKGTLDRVNATKPTATDSEAKSLSHASDDAIDAEAWARISGRSSYRCGYCADLFAAMSSAADAGGASSAMDVLRDYKGMICTSIEWMRWPSMFSDDAAARTEGTERT